MSEENLIGRICWKIAGREGNRIAIITNVLSNNFVEIDGQVKRRRCNLAHLELSNKQLKIKKGASTEEVRELLKTEGVAIDYKKKESSREKPKRVKAPKKAGKSNLSEPIKK